MRNPIYSDDWYKLSLPEKIDCIRDLCYDVFETCDPSFYRIQDTLRTAIEALK